MSLYTLIRNKLLWSVIRPINALGYSVVRLDRFAMADQQRLLDGRKVETIFDVGASSGATVGNYRRTFPDATIYAFEPLPSSWSVLRDKFAHDARVRPVNSALGAHQHKAIIPINAAAETSSLLRAVSPERLPASYGALYSTNRTAEVTVDTLDAFARRERVESIDLLKLDVQGFELEVLKGARDLLTSKCIEVIYAEVWFVEVYEKAPLFQDVLLALAEFGIELFAIHEPTFNSSSGRLMYADALFAKSELLQRAGRSPMILT